MAGISKQVWIFLLATGGIAPLVHASEPPPVHYDIGLDVKHDDVEAITVRASLRADANGIVDFDAPWQDVAEVHAEAGTLDTSTKGRWRVTTQPGANVVLAWRSGKPEHMNPMPWGVWQRIVDQSHAVEAAGAAFLAMPQGSARRPVTVTMSMPAGWRASTGLDAQGQTVESSKAASFLAGRELRTATRSTGAGTTLRVSAAGPSQPDVSDMADAIVELLTRTESEGLSPLKRLPQGGTTPLTLNIATFDGSGGWGMSLNHANAVLYLSKGFPPGDWLTDIIVHFVAVNSSDSNPRDAWFTRGVTAFRVTDALRKSRRLSDASFAGHMDRTIVAYGGSPLRRASNARVIDDYDRIEEMHDLPLKRGELFAWLVDARLREATQGRKQLMDALKSMNAGDGDPGPAFIAAVAAEGGGDITPLYQRYIVNGELLQLPPDALGPCFSIGTVADIYNWQVQHVFAKPVGTCRAPPSVAPLSAAPLSVGAASAAIPGRDPIRR